MSWLGFAGGSQQSRASGVVRRVWAQRAAAPSLYAAALSLVLCGCSGSTDVVGMLAAESETEALEGTSESDSLQGSSDVTRVQISGEFSIVAGMPVAGWEGRPALAWPFDVSLEEFFANGSWPGPFGPPPRVGRQVMAVMGRTARLENVRVVAAAPEIAERLRDVFPKADVDLDGEMVARVMRDWRSDEYRVALGTASCGRAASHHGGPCADTAGFERP